MAQPDFSPSAERNKHPILEVLRTVLPASGNALEIASGTGQHITWFAQHLPNWTWLPTDLHRGALYSVEAYADQAELINVYAPLQLDVMAEQWLPVGQKVDLILCINMLHIAPWATCGALMRGSAQHLAQGGKLITYGPYIENGVSTVESNLAFDQSLRAHEPTYGIRRREDVEHEAARVGLSLLARHAMAANNLLLVWGA